MGEMLRKVLRIGSSLAVTFPAELEKVLGEYCWVEIDQERRRLIIRKAEVK
ncbi:MAG: hypothetical protein QW328_08050 [Nitrososphaerota archaeon]